MRKANVLEQFLCAQSQKFEMTAAVVRSVVNARLWSEPTRYRFYPELPYAKLPATVFLRSYCQAAGYAQAVEERLRAELKLREKPNGGDAEALEAIAASRCPVSVHIRRGDYALANEMLVLPLSYYEQACKLMLDEFEGVEFFVFSDDIEFARKFLPAEGPRRFVSHNNGWSAYQDLRLMAACRHHIIANSSFSWWGAWMNPDPGKVVIAPKYWWNKPESYYPELFPAGWRLVDNLIDLRDGTKAG